MKHHALALSVLLIAGCQGCKSDPPAPIVVIVQAPAATATATATVARDTRDAQMCLRIPGETIRYSFDAPVKDMAECERSAVSLCMGEKKLGARLADDGPTETVECSSKSDRKAFSYLRCEPDGVMFIGPGHEPYRKPYSSFPPL